MAFLILKKINMISKSRIRNKFKNYRKKISKPIAQNLSTKFIESFMISYNLSDFDNKNIAIYYPINNEVDILLLAGELQRKCKNITFSFPVVINKSEKLIFRKCNPFNYWEYKQFIAGLIYSKIPEPNEFCEEVTPDIILTPLVAYDKKGNRLGMGGGYYDRTLDNLRKNHNTKVIGVGYDWQNCDFLIPEKNDEIVEII